MANNPSRYEQILAWLDQHIIRRLYTERVRRVILQSLPFWVASILTGLIAVGYERLFSWAEQLSFTWLRTQPLLAFAHHPSSLFSGLVSGCQAGSGRQGQRYSAGNGGH